MPSRIVGRSPLTAKQLAFVDAYVATLNATEASRRAGYKDTRSGFDAFHQPEVRAAIVAKQQQLAAESGCTPEKVIGKFCEIAFMPIDAPVTRFEQLKALDSLARHLGLFNDKVHLSGTLTLAELIRDSLEERAAEADAESEAEAERGFGEPEKRGNGYA